MTTRPSTVPAPSPASTYPKMQFSDIYKSPRSPLTKIRHSVLPPPLVMPVAPVYDADLLSKDKLKQKEAVKRHIAEKVRNDWEFTWPPPSSKPAEGGPEPDAAQAADEDGENAENGGPNGDPNGDPAVVSSNSEPTTGSDEGDPQAPTATLAAASTQPDVPLESTDGDLEESDAETLYSSVSEDEANYKPRLSWASDLSDSEDEAQVPPQSPFRFDTPDAIGMAVKQSASDKAAGQRRALREEMKWNDGLACFEARRNAWTSAKTVRVREKPPSPSLSMASLSPRRLFSRHSPPAVNSPVARTQSHEMPTGGCAAAAAGASDGSDVAPSKDVAAGSAELTMQRSKDSSRSAASVTAAPMSRTSTSTMTRSSTSITTTTRHRQQQQQQQPPRTYRVETLLPIPPPLLPPNNPMRASITPAVYISLYEKVILQNLTPSCPVNLADMLRACVAGWKRDGEWPPKPSGPEGGVGAAGSIVAVRKKKKRGSIVSGGGESGSRRMSFGFLGGRTSNDRAEGEDGAVGSPTGRGGIRKSLQKVLGFGSGGAHPQVGAASASATQGLV